MLSTRLVSAFLGIIILIIIVGAPGIYLNIALTIIALMGLNEMFNAFKAANIKPVRWVGYISVLFVLFSQALKNINSYSVMYLIFFIVVLTLFLHVVLSNNKITYIDVSVTLLAIFYISFLFSFFILTRNMEKGYLYIWFILIGGWVTDSGAYFVGKFFGKHKLIPVISPKKTIEGAVGGVVICTIIMLLYGLFIKSYYAVNISIIHYLILGVVVSIFGQLGDLSASAIKRSTGIKDFGNIIPGHGGIIDRFDSILFVAPIVYFYLTIIVLK